MFTLSVAMIVKNEQKSLARILKCVKKFADELIIVDTGSKDDTVKIALDYTDKVFFYSWRDDFAAARNYAFSKASCDYIMWLDADDYITFKNVKKIKRLKERGGADMYTCSYQIAFDESGNCVFEFIRERIIKNVGARWQGFIHEAIPFFGKVVATDIAIEHRKIGGGDKRRNLKIYRKHIAMGETLSARDRYYYARELFYNGYYRAAGKALDKIIEENALQKSDLRDALIMLAECYFALKNNKKALYKLINGLSLINASAKYHCMIGRALKEKELLGAAAVFYEKALICPYDGMGFFEREYSDIVPYLELCYLYYRLGDEKRSFEYHLMAKSVNPKNASVVFNEKYFLSKGFSYTT